MAIICYPLPVHLYIKGIISLSAFVLALSKLMNKIPICLLPFDSLQPKGLPTTAFAFLFSMLLFVG